MTAESLIESFLKEIEFITDRLQIINESYQSIMSNELKERLINEYKDLKKRYKEISEISFSISNRTKDKITISNLLNEKCERGYKEICKNNNLFFV